MTTRDTDRVFSSSVSEVYDDLLVPLLFEPYAEDLVGRLRDVLDGAILEVAAGTGVVTRAIARALPAGVSITATDLNQAMLDRAMQIGTARPVRWEQADVMSLPFADATFDVAVCQFGAMFFDPKPAAFAEIRRTLRPEGRLVFSVWDGVDDNEFADTVSQSVAGMFPDDPPQFVERTPHGYHDHTMITADLRAGGFDAAPVFEGIEYRRRAASAHDVATAFCTGTPLRGELERRRAGCLPEAVAVATSALEQRFGTADLEGRMSAQIVTVAANAPQKGA